jgi:plastocyanin
MKHLLLSLALATLPCLASAGTLQVTVLGSDGKPAADVAVQVLPAAPWSAQPPAEPVRIVQRNLRFVPFVSVVPAGGTVRFVNRDRYDHHVRSQAGGPLGNVAPAQQFEFRMAAFKGEKESTADLKLDTPGVIALGCHLHGSMRGHVLVSATPWVAVTDEQGRATLPQLPDGQAELKLWHPEQLADQAPLRLQLAGDQVAEARVNFAPRRRPPPSAAPSPSPTRSGDYTF